MRFYGLDVTLETVKEYLCSKTRPFPSLEAIEEQQMRRLIEHLLRFDPRERWTAARACGNAVFQSADDTVQKQTGIQQARLANALDVTE